MPFGGGGGQKIEAKEMSFKCIIYLSWLLHEIFPFRHFALSEGPSADEMALCR